MASKMFFVFIFSILQCGLVLSSSNLLKSLSNRVNDSPIPLSELIHEIQHGKLEDVEAHYLLMTLIHSYGGRLYDLSKNLSTECSRTIKATTLTVENLAVCDEAILAKEVAYKGAVQDVRNAKQLEEHPLELFCSRIEKSFSADPKLSVAFLKAKTEAAKFVFTSRPPSARMILKTSTSVVFKIFEMFAVPEFARLIVISSFAEQTNVDHMYSWRYHYFVKSCQAVAKSEQFADSMQRLFGKAVDETVPDISADDRVERFFQAIDKRGVYWVPKLMKTVYKYIASDANMKKELENMAAIVGKDAIDKDNLDFSKL